MYLCTRKTDSVRTALNNALAAKFSSTERLINKVENYQVFYNLKAIQAQGLSYDDVKSQTVDLLKQDPDVLYACDMEKVAEATIPDEVKTRIVNGYNRERSGGVQIVLKPSFYTHGTHGTDHSAWNPYDTHIPLVFMGWGIEHGATTRQTSMTDIAPTVAALLHVQAPNGERVLTYKIKDKYKDMTLEQIYNSEKKTVKCDDANVSYGYAAKYMDFIDYDFADAYVADPQDTGNRPGIYIEFKESWLNPKDMEVRVYNVLDECGWNIVTKPANGQPFYAKGHVNVGQTNGKVILQTFSFDALTRAYNVFQGKVPMCFLLWTGTYATDLKYNTPTGYADFINYGLEHGAHIMGPAISGAPNNYPEMNNPWQAYMIRRAKMLNHPYSFDSYAQMAKYMGYYNDYYNAGNTTEFDDLLLTTVPSTAYSNFTGTKSTPVYMDGFFTNRSEMSLRFMLENGFRCNASLPNPFHAGQTYDNSQAPSTVPDAEATLTRLGY